MICPHCGSKIAATAKLCPYCNKVTDSAPAYTRPANTSNTAHKATAAPIQKTPPKSAKSKKSVWLLISAVLGVLYIIYSVFYWGGASSGSSNTAYTLGVGIATYIVMPHLLCAFFAAICNVIGWTMNSRGFALSGAILYAVAIVMFPMYFIFVIVQMVLSFIGFVLMKN